MSHHLTSFSLIVAMISHAFEPPLSQNVNNKGIDFSIPFVLLVGFEHAGQIVLITLLHCRNTSEPLVIVFGRIRWPQGQDEFL